MPVKRWTKDEERRLRQLHEDGLKWAEVASALGRTLKSVSHKAVTLKLVSERSRYEGWEPEVLAFHRKHYDNGLSHSRLAEAINLKFGLNITRSASIGKANREGYPPRDHCHNGDKGRKRARLKPEQIAAPRPKPRTVSGLEPEPLNLTLVELTDRKCKWAINDGGPFLFCGHEAEHGSSYCPHHAQRVVNTAPAKSRMNWSNFGHWKAKWVDHGEAA